MIAASCVLRLILIIVCSALRLVPVISVSVRGLVLIAASCVLWLIGIIAGCVPRLVPVISGSVLRLILVIAGCILRLALIIAGCVLRLVLVIAGCVLRLIRIIPAVVPGGHLVGIRVLIVVYCLGFASEKFSLLLFLLLWLKYGFASGPSDHTNQDDTEKNAHAVNAHIFHGRAAPHDKRLVVFISAGEAHADQSGYEHEQDAVYSIYI